MKHAKHMTGKGAMKPKEMESAIQTMPAHAMPKKGGKKGKGGKKRTR